MNVQIFTPKNFFGSNMYLIYSEKEAAVIDPSMKYNVLKDRILENGLTVKYIILTHAHFDHMLEIYDWAENTGAEVIIGYEEAEGLSDSTLNCYRHFFHCDKGYYGKYTTVDDGDLLTLSDEKIKVISTPGHTRGSITLLTGDSLFTGDLIFADGNYGRCDLPGGDIYTLALSISKICELDGSLTVYSGHGPKTNLEEYKRNRRI